MTDIDIRADAVRDTVRRLEDAWAKNDADGVAEVYTEDTSLILTRNDTYLKGREAIRSYFAAAYGGPMKDTRVVGTPLDIKRVSDDVVVMTTNGGVLYPGQTAVSAENAIRATWVFVRQGQDWLISAYHNSPTVHAEPVTGEER
jgi:uncharacterized protein (TIGR02246 family)